jgi:DNA-directed RNA polymerase subunit alpha
MPDVVMLRWNSAKVKKLEVGTIAIDSLFSPVVNVGFTLENTRVGEMTNYEKLILNIETDGTITPEEAVTRATNLLVKQFSALTGAPVVAEAAVAVETTEAVDDLEEKVEELGDETKTKKRGRPKKSEK